MFPVALEDVNVTEPPEQKDVGPLADIVGVEGDARRLIFTDEDTTEQGPLDTVNE